MLPKRGGDSVHPTPMVQPLTRSHQLYAEHADLLAHGAGYSSVDLDALLSEARAELEVAAPGERWMLWSLTGWIEERQGRLDEALASHLRAHELAHDNPATLVAVGSVLGLMRRHGEALPYLLQAEQKIAKGTWHHLIVLCNLVVADHAAGDRQGARRWLAQARRVARTHAPLGHIEVAYAACFIDDDGEVLESVARFVVAAEGRTWDDPDPLPVIQNAAPGTLDLSGWPEVVRLALERVMASEDEEQRPAAVPLTPVLPPAPTANELARAEAMALDEDGDVDPLALALALAVPSLGVGPSDDHSFRFAHDRPMRRLASGDG